MAAIRRRVQRVTNVHLALGMSAVLAATGVVQSLQGIF